MSSLPRGFEPQAPEDLGQRSLVELREMLKRQERLLRNVPPGEWTEDLLPHSRPSSWPGTFACEDDSYWTAP
ncbi:hypothetical protein P7K49_016954 [Saguinus oedipus]|uniref:Uncharacterized protein n=1 Tax=Saguinus oedipus TaxID=9490 RepID=A0ABQ9V127_SAGOE|nr:hypothetical protein P7K49_016954 [Saguinus oedipus]